MRHNQPIFSDAKERKQKLKRLINFYHTVKPHKAISGKTPYAL
ncbi:transposase [Gilliamella intestini]|nr:transposase [Gilliamella intestini]